MRNSIRFSSKKLAVLLLIVAVCTVGVAFAAVKFTRNDAPADSTVLQSSDTAANKVTIYGNGVTFVEYTEPITLDNDTSTVQFYLPSGALTDTLAVSGINVATITTSEESQPIIASGDMITVYTANGSYTGKFISWDTMLLLEADNGTVMIPDTSITSIVLDQVVQVQGPQILVQVTTDSPPGDARASTLASSLSLLLQFLTSSAIRRSSKSFKEQSSQLAKRARYWVFSNYKNGTYSMGNESGKSVKL